MARIAVHVNWRALDNRGDCLETNLATSLTGVAVVSLTAMVDNRQLIEELECKVVLQTEVGDAHLLQLT